jgi:sulfide:quinone oxidoreductase
MSTESSRPLNVVVIGGGVASLETVIALRRLAGDRTRITMVAPEAEFVYRPLTVAEPFGRGLAKRYAPPAR